MFCQNDSDLFYLIFFPTKQGLKVTEWGWKYSDAHLETSHPMFSVAKSFSTFNFYVLSGKVTTYAGVLHTVYSDI